MVYSANGPACTARWPGESPSGAGGCLVQVPQSKKGAVRALTDKEVWRMHGGSREKWEAEPEEGRGALVKQAVASCPPKTAEAVLVWALEVFEPRRKAGACRDPEEEAAWKALQRLLRA